MYYFEHGRFEYVLNLKDSKNFFQTNKTTNTQRDVRRRPVSISE